MLRKMADLQHVRFGCICNLQKKSDQLKIIKMDSIRDTRDWTVQLLCFKNLKKWN